MNRILLPVVAIAAALTLSACGDSGDSAVPGFGDAPVATDAAGSGEGPGEGSAIDACTLFTEDELTEVLGRHEREQWSSTGESSCQWANAEDASVSIDVDRAGTAPGGEVPPEEAMGESEAGADGVTYYGLGYTTFPVGDRACRLQVVVTLGDPMADRPAIDRLVGLVRERL